MVNNFLPNNDGTRSIKKSEIISTVCSRVIEHFSKASKVPSKLEIQNYISSFVDEYKVDTGKWDTSGEVPKKVYKPLVDYYTKMAINEIKTCQEAIIANQAVIKYPEITEQMNIVKLLKELKKVCWNIRASDIPEFVRELLEFALYARTGQTIHPETESFEYMRGIYLKSEMEGCGKSTILRKIEDAAEKAGLRVSQASWPLGRFGDMTVYSKSNIAILDDTDVQVLRNINETKLKAILRHREVDNEYKGLDAVSVKANAAIIAAGNVEPPKASDRCWRIFDIIPAQVEGYMNETDWGNEILREANTANLSQLFNIFNIFKVLDKVTKISKSLKNVKKEDLIEKEERVYERCKYLNSILEILKLMQDGPYDFHRISIKEIVDFSIAASKPLDAWKVVNTFKVLYGNDAIAKDKVKGSTEYQKYDLKGLELREPGSEVNTDDDSTTVREEIVKNQQIWDLLIKEFTEPTNPEDRFLKGSDEKLDDSWTVCTKYDKEGEYNANGDQVCVNKPLEGETKNRTNARVHKQNFLFECDDIPVKQQVEQIENAPQELKDSLLWTCFTGGKSIHAVVHTNLSDEEGTPECRKYIHQKLSEKYFGGHADKSGQNASRLARAPNAIRQDEKHPGAKQLCLQFNMDAKPLDVSGLVEDYKEDERLRRSLKELTGRPSIPEECRREPSIHTLEDLEKWNMKAPSKAKEECIKFLNGTLEDWNRSIACVRELRNFGFSDYEIESEGPANDRWIKSALKAAN